MGVLTTFLGCSIIVLTNVKEIKIWAVRFMQSALF